MAKRLFDIIVSAVAFVACGPVILVAAIAVKLSSPGPAFHVASRVGRDGHRFAMYKLRTMHCRDAAGSSITAVADPRVFFVGHVLRASKIDELPQLWNILTGDMSLVGPRPEAVDIVEHYYNDEYQKTLHVRPGLLSPGSLYNYTHGDQILDGSDTSVEEVYATRLLPEKMALELAYLQHCTPLTDLRLMLHTAAVLVQKAFGRKRFPKPEMLETRPRVIEMPPTRAAA